MSSGRPSRVVKVRKRPLRPRIRPPPRVPPRACRRSPRGAVDGLRQQPFGRAERRDPSLPDANESPARGAGPDRPVTSGGHHPEPNAREAVLDAEGSEGLPLRAVRGRVARDPECPRCVPGDGVGVPCSGGRESTGRPAASPSMKASPRSSPPR